MLLPPVCVLAGVAASYSVLGTINVTNLVLALIGALLAHGSVNILNTYFDYKSGIDFHTEKTPFSGGSSVLVSGLLDAKKALIFGLATMAAVFCIGVYFFIQYSWTILPIGLGGLVLIYAYTPYITKIPILTEMLGAGLGFGLITLGTYFTQTGGYGTEGIYASVVVGLLVANLLLLNEFPDVEADLINNRKHLPIVIGRSKSAVVYCLITAAAYVVLLISVTVGGVSWLALLGLTTLPLGIKAMRGVLKYNSNTAKLLPSLSVNVMVVLLTPLLMGIGIIIAKAVS
jgi:1,4-dihydroxy-2-naphthoate octaprenyltransferase